MVALLGVPSTPAARLPPRFISSVVIPANAPCSSIVQCQARNCIRTRYEPSHPAEIVRASSSPWRGLVSNTGTARNGMNEKAFQCCSRARWQPRYGVSSTLATRLTPRRTPSVVNVLLFRSPLESMETLGSNRFVNHGQALLTIASGAGVEGIQLGVCHPARTLHGTARLCGCGSV